MSASGIVAIALIAASFVAALGAVLTRALFASVMAVAGAGALIASALAFLGATQGALAAALGFAALAPILLLGVVLLTVRSAKTQTSRARWFAAAAAIVIAGVVFMGADELGGDAVAPRFDANAFPWVGVAVFAAIAACVGALGFGEAGALERREP